MSCTASAYKYDLNGQVIETRTTTRDDQGNTGASDDIPGWIITRTLYDSRGRVEFTTDPYYVSDADYVGGAWNGKAWLGSRTVYDFLGRPESTERWKDVKVELVQDTNAPSGSGIEKAVLSSSFGLDTPILDRLSASTTAYDDLGRVHHTINLSGARTDYYYDRAGRQVGVLGPVAMVNGIETRHLTFSLSDSAGRLTQSWSNIAVTGFDLNAPSPQLEGELHPDFVFNGNVIGGANGSWADITEAQITYYEYDRVGRQTAVVTTAVDHDGDSATERIHLRTETGYDNRGNRVSTTEGFTQTNPHDPSTIERSAARTTSYAYDDSGALVRVTLPEVDHPTLASETGSPLRVRPVYEYDYNEYRDRITIRDNAFLTVEAGAGHAVGELVYDHDPNNSDSTDDTRSTRFAFDWRGAQIERRLPLANEAVDSHFVERMVYSDQRLGEVANQARSVVAGQLERSIDFEGRVTNYWYDNTAAGAGRLIEKEYRLAVSGAATEKVTYAYDQFGREIEVVISRFSSGPTTTHTTTTVYDDHGRIETITTNDDGLTTTLGYEYDPTTGDRIRTFTGSGSSPDTATDYHYDDQGRLHQVILTHREGANIADETTTYHHDLQGRVDYEVLPSGTTRDIIYDELGRVDRIDHFVDGDSDGLLDSEVNQIASFDYAWTAVLLPNPRR